MKKRFLIFSLFLLTIFSAISFAGDPPGQKKIFTITLDDDIITPVAAEYIISSIERAEEENAIAVIIKLDTPGGLLTSTRKIVKKMMNSKVPVVVYVAPKGARAGSAGVFITLAANIAAMAPSTNIGAAHPVSLTGEGGMFGKMKELVAGKDKDSKKDKKVRKEPMPMNDKILNDTKAWVEGIAKERGRNIKWAISAVEKSASITETEAVKLGIADFIAKDMNDLVAKLNGKNIKVDEKTIVLKTTDAKIIDIEKNFRLKWLSVLAHPNIAYILMMLGFYGLLFEFTNPGIGFPGIAGAVCLVLAFFGLQVLPTNYAGVALIIMAIAMLIAEIKVVSYGLLTLGGLATFFIGSLILFTSPYDFMNVSLYLILSFVAATLAISLILIFVILKNRRKRSSTGNEGLIGLTGEAIEWKGGRGKVMVHGEIWNAKSNGQLSKGDTINVVIVDGMTILVEKKT